MLRNACKSCEYKNVVVILYYITKQTNMTVITNANIRNLVEQYINGPDWSDDFPEDLVGIPIGDWDVSHVTNMEELFRYADFN